MILSVFGGVFCLLTAQRLSQHRFGLIVSVVGVCTACLLASIAFLQTKRIPVTEYPGRTRRIMLWSTIGEGVGILAGINVVINMGHPDLVLPVISLAVALHFLPMAAAIPFPRFYALAAGLAAVAVAGAMLAAPVGPMLTGFGSALCLWIAAAIRILENSNQPGARPIRPV
jgi:hypothetical protein